MAPRKIDPLLAEILRKYQCDPATDIWDCHGTWVAYHRTLEKIATQAGVVYDPPTVLVAERDAAAILVVGSIGDKREWSIGEAVINQNYKVSGKQAAYPFAMAEKRAKDRVIIKLVGLHGVYSEDEADDFKEARPTAPRDEERPTKAAAAKPASNGSHLSHDDSAKLRQGLLQAMKLARDPRELSQWGRDNATAISTLIPAHQEELRSAFADLKLVLQEEQTSLLENTDA